MFLDQTRCKKITFVFGSNRRQKKITKPCSGLLVASPPESGTLFFILSHYHILYLFRLLSFITSFICFDFSHLFIANFINCRLINTTGTQSVSFVSFFFFWLVIRWRLIDFVELPLYQVCCTWSRNYGAEDTKRFIDCETSFEFPYKLF